MNAVVCLTKGDKFNIQQIRHRCHLADFPLLKAKIVLNQINQMKKDLLSIGILLAMALELSAQKSPVFNSEGSAIRGYDAVAYFKEGKAVKGTNEFAYEWNGSKWNFVSQQNLDSFKTTPEKYAPQYGGYCAYGVFEGHKAPTDPNAWTIVEGKLYFNYNFKVRELWRNKTEEKILIADEKWPQFKDKD